MSRRRKKKKKNGIQRINKIKMKYEEQDKANAGENFSKKRKI